MIDIDDLIERTLEETEADEIHPDYLVARIPNDRGGYRELTGNAARDYMMSRDCDARYIGIAVARIRRDWLADWNSIKRRVAERLAAEGWEA